MDIITRIQKNSYDIPSILTKLSKNKRFILFDIETTGLNPNYDKVILIGILYQEGDNIIIKQFFCNNSSEELELLKSFIENFHNFQFYITFNGNTFDIPFLNKRFSKYNLDYKIDPYLNLDLYRVVRKNKNLLNLNNCKLKTVENFLGINRNDTIDGAESVELFKKYEVNKDNELKGKILLHNFEDILHLLPTLNILNYIDKDSIIKDFPKEFSLHEKVKVRIIDYKIKKDFLEVSGKFYGSLNQDFIFYNHSYNFSLLKENKQLKLKLPLLSINTCSNETYSFFNLNQLNYKRFNLSKLSNEEKLKYVVKKGNKIKHSNIYSFIQDFSLHIFKQICIDINN